MPPSDRTRIVLDFLHGQLLAPQGAVPKEFLEALAESFGAGGAGLAQLAEGSPRVERVGRRERPAAAAGWPWQERPQLLKFPGGAPEVWRLTGETWLVVPLMAANGLSRLLWVEDNAERSWSAGEKAALALAGHTLGQRLPELAAGEGKHEATDTERFQQRLQDAAVVSGRVAHAFDNVLTGILGFAELTLSQVPANSTTHQYLGEVLRAAQLGSQLTQELRSFNVCAQGGKGPTPLSQVAAEEETRLRQVLPPGVQLKCEVPADLPPVALDAEPLRHLLAHLLDNARESLNREGTIALQARLAELTAASCGNLIGRPEPGRYVEVTVTDSGSGLSAEAQKRLFVEPFFSSKPRHRGLGLAVVCRVLFAHHGGFRLEPGAKGGTVARAFLPLASRT